MIKYTEELQQAVESVKWLLTPAPVSNNSIFFKKFYLHCDAIDYGTT